MGIGDVSIFGNKSHIDSPTPSKRAYEVSTVGPIEVVKPILVISKDVEKGGGGIIEENRVLPEVS